LKPVGSGREHTHNSRSKGIVQDVLRSMPHILVSRPVEDVQLSEKCRASFFTKHWQPPGHFI